MRKSHVESRSRKYSPVQYVSETHDHKLSYGAQTWAEEDMIQGYLDGFDVNSPEPSDNRFSYRHGFANGRDDLARKPKPLRTQAVARRKG